MKELKPKQHPDAKGHYTKIVNGKTVHVCADGVGYPPISPEDPVHELFIQPLLEVISKNASIPEYFKPFISDSLFHILKTTPDSIGIVSAAGYSGLRASSLLKTLEHSVHGKAFSAELIIAGLLVTKGSTATNGHFIRITDSDRLDFGIKLDPMLNTRKTVEADIMVHFKSGKRIGIDAKFSSRARYPGHISKNVLTGICNAIHNKEIDEFHFMSNAKFSSSQKKMSDGIIRDMALHQTAISFHENFWPTNR